MCDHGNRAEPVLAIVIPSNRRVDLLRRCLATVTGHAPPKTQIIVVDDASTNGCVSRAAAEFSSVEVVRLPRRSGFCVAVNQGILAARAPIVELLNDDTEVEPGWATAALKYFADAQVVAVAPLVLRLVDETADPEPPRIDSAGDTYHLGGFAQKRGGGTPLAQFSLEPIGVFGANATSSFFRRAALFQVGLFPESFESYFEDVDVSFRLRHAGGTIMFAPDARVWHRVHGTYGTPQRRLLEQQSRNEERVFWRNMPDHLLTRALAVHGAALLAKAWRRWREGTLASFLVGRLRALSELRTLWRQRRHILANSSAAAVLPLETAWSGAARRA